MNSTDIVPFGKYAGRPVSDLLSDSSYINWLKNQKWFQEKYGKLFVVVNMGYDPSLVDQPTPDHNIFQNKFLDKAYRVAVWKKCKNFIM